MKKILFLVVVFAYMQFSHAQSSEWSSLENLFQKKAVIKGDVARFNFPRTDLNVTVDGIKIEPGFALTSWAGFEKMDKGAMVMGDLVLLEPEAVKVIPDLISNGISVTAIHNHLLTETPKIIYAHIEATGDIETLGKKIKNALALTKTPFTSATPDKVTEPDWSAVEKNIPAKGIKNGNIISFGIPRKEKIIENGMPVPPIMGTAIGINFQKAGDKAIVTGDFVMLQNEVIPVEQALTKAGITVTALHTHMITEQPKLYFMHFWGYDTQEKLSAGLKEALSLTNSGEK